MFKKLVLIAAACGAAVAIPVLAQHDVSTHKMMEPMSKAEAEARVKERFAFADANGDGFITEAEVAAAHEKRTAARQDQHFAMLDANKDGSISRAEFDAGHTDRAAMRGHRGPGAGMMMRKHGGGMGHGGGDHGMGGGNMLLRADANKDGKVSLSEAMAKPMARFEGADANKDGTLTPEERKAARQERRMERREKRM